MRWWLQVCSHHGAVWPSFLVPGWLPGLCLLPHICSGPAPSSVGTSSPSRLLILLTRLLSSPSFSEPLFVVGSRAWHFPHTVPSLLNSPTLTSAKQHFSDKQLEQSFFLINWIFCSYFNFNKEKLSPRNILANSPRMPRTSMQLCSLMRTNNLWNPVSNFHLCILNQPLQGSWKIRAAPLLPS